MNGYFFTIATPYYSKFIMDVVHICRLQSFRNSSKIITYLPILIVPIHRKAITFYKTLISNL